MTAKRLAQLSCLSVSIVLAILLTLYTSGLSIFPPVPSVQTATAGTTQTCLGLFATATEHFNRAKADPNYADCLNRLAKQQAKGCEIPANPKDVDAYSSCLEQRGCDRPCGRRATVFHDLALVTPQYHELAKRCKTTQIPSDCEQVHELEAIMEGGARMLDAQVDEGVF